MTYKLFKIQIDLSSVSSWSSLVDSHLLSFQRPKQHIVSIMQKRPPKLWLTLFSKANNFIISIMQKKAFCTLTYTLFKTHTIPVSASFREGLLNPDLQPVQKPNHSIVSIMQTSPPRPWLTVCSKPKKNHYQHDAGKAVWMLTYILFGTQSISLSASRRKGCLDCDLPPIQSPEKLIVSIMQNNGKGHMDLDLPPV